MDYYLSYTDSNSSDWKRFKQYWREILSIYNDLDAKCIVVILPKLNLLSDRHPFLTTYSRVEELSKNNGALVLNIFPFVKGLNPRELHVGVTEAHPNEKAHRIFADRIFDFLINKNIVGNSQ